MSEYEVAVRSSVPEPEQSSLKQILSLLHNNGAFATVPRAADLYHVTRSEHLDLTKPTFFASTEKWGMTLQMTRNDEMVGRMSDIEYAQMVKCRELMTGARPVPPFYNSVHVRTNDRRPLLMDLTEEVVYKNVLAHLKRYYSGFVGCTSPGSWTEQDMRLQRFVTMIDGLDGWFRHDFLGSEHLIFDFTTREIMLQDPRPSIDFVGERRVMPDELFAAVKDFVIPNCGNAAAFELGYKKEVRGIPMIPVDVRIRK